MGLKAKGKKILKETGYSKIREQLLKDVTESINIEGSHGDKIVHHIKNALEKEGYSYIKDELIKKIGEKMGVESEKEALDILLVILQENLRPELCENLYTHSKKGTELISDDIYRKGEEKKIWKHVHTIILGKQTSLLGDLMILLKVHSIIRWTLIVGFLLFMISSILLDSVYKSVIAGLTLTAEPGESLRIMLGNILGALGGILIFFVFISLLIQDKYLASTRNDKLRRLADRTLKNEFER